MSKAKFTIYAIPPLLLTVVSAGFAYDIANDECARAPDGTFHWDLLADGYAHWRDLEADCDPWAVVEPVKEVTRLTIGSHANNYSSYRPSNRVRIEKSGSITVLAPIDDFGEEFKQVAETKNVALADELIAKLSRYLNYNRYRSEIPEDADLSDPSSIQAEPILACSAESSSDGWIYIIYSQGDAEEVYTSLSGKCISKASDKLRRDFWAAHERGLTAAGYRNERYPEPSLEPVS